MANINYYSFKFSLSKFFFFFFFLLYVEHDISPGVLDCWNRIRGSREIKDLYLDRDIIVLYQVLVGLEHFFVGKIDENTTNWVRL